MTEKELDDIVNSVIKNKRYRGIDLIIVRRICEENSKKYKKTKDIIKNSRNDLHIMHESFLTDNCYTLADEIITKFNNKQDVKDASELLLKLHVSTNERLPYLNEIYTFISKYINETSVIGDIGCGFNPFALPYLKTEPKEYYAYDISNESVCILNKYFSFWNNDYKANVLDASISTPEKKFNVVFIFKLIPLLQQQKKMRGYNLIKELNFDIAIVSFPTKTLGGHNRGMENFYSEQLKANLNYAIIDELKVENEIFYVIKKE